MTLNNSAAITSTPAPRAGAYPWNDKPLLPIDRGIPTHEEMHRAARRQEDYLQAKKQVDSQLDSVSASIYWRFDQREKQKGIDSARRLWGLT